MQAIAHPRSVVGQFPEDTLAKTNPIKSLFRGALSSMSEIVAEGAGARLTLTKEIRPGGLIALIYSKLE